jgi:hypothetical protein
LGRTPILLAERGYVQNGAIDTRSTRRIRLRGASRDGKRQAFGLDRAIGEEDGRQIDGAHKRRCHLPHAGPAARRSREGVDASDVSGQRGFIGVHEHLEAGVPEDVCGGKDTESCSARSHAIRGSYDEARLLEPLLDAAEGPLPGSWAGGRIPLVLASR